MEETKAVKVRKRRKIKSSMIQDYILAAIPLLYIFIFSYLPMGGIIIAFKNYRYDRGIFGSDWVGFKNFEFFFASNDFVRIVRNTIVMNAIFITVGIIAAVATAIVLYGVLSRTKIKIFQTILITPHFISWVVAAYMVYGFLNTRYGLVNKALEAMGMAKIDWYSNPAVWPAILTIASVWKHVGMDSVTYFAALMGIDTSLIEAAKIDGATRWQVRRHVIIPCLVPIITILTILKIGNIFRADFGLFYQLPRNIGTLYETTDVVDTYIFRTTREIGDMGMGSAAGLLQSLVGMVLVIFTNWVAKKIDPDRGLF